MCFYFISVNHGIREPKETYYIGLILWPVSLKLENNRKVLGTRDLDDWNDLQDKLGEITPTGEKDTMIWKLNKSGQYTSRSLYREILFGGVRDTNLQNLWEAYAPLKVKIFFWLILKGRIQAAARLKKMNWKREPYCKLCRIEESVNDLIFRCAPAWFLWCCLRVVFGWNEIPSSGAELINLLQGPKRDILFYCCVAASWAIWLQETIFCFNGKLMKNILHLLHKMISFYDAVEKLNNKEGSWGVGDFANIQRAGGPR